ncbi:MAG TPA: hypothetical protein VEK79_02320 [Thermoanaerobaculia bacterium]|nr:hypothetical protein [Thermoanaerobaculia bacterium]
MKKTFTLIAFTALVAVQSFAANYIVVLKNGQSFTAKEKWTVVNGKAIVKLTNGQSLQLDPSLIDVAKSEQMTKFGTASASVVDLSPNLPAAQAPKQQTPSLGTSIKLRPKNAQPTEPQSQKAATTTPTPAVVAVTPGSLASDVINKFERAYENDGIFELKVASTGTGTYRVELTVDTEDRVFGAISTTAAMIVRNAFVDGATINGVDLFMKTTTGGAAGRFQMSRADAEALLSNKVKREEYFISKVIY